MATSTAKDMWTFEAERAYENLQCWGWSGRYPNGEPKLTAGDVDALDDAISVPGTAFSVIAAVLTLVNKIDVELLQPASGGRYPDRLPTDTDDRRALSARIRAFIHKLEERCPALTECPVCLEPFERAQVRDQLARFEFMACGHRLHVLCRARLPIVSMSGCPQHQAVPNIPHDCEACIAYPRIIVKACPVCKAHTSTDMLAQFVVKR